MDPRHESRASSSNAPDVEQFQPSGGGPNKAKASTQFLYDLRSINDIVEMRHGKPADYLRLREHVMQLQQAPRAFINHQIHEQNRQPKTWAWAVRSVEVDPATLRDDFPELVQAMADIDPNCLALELIRLLHVERGFQLANQNYSQYVMQHYYNWAREHQKIERFIDETSQRLQYGNSPEGPPPAMGLSPEAQTIPSVIQPSDDRPSIERP